MLLAERLRDEGEREVVREVIEKQLKVDIDCDTVYFGDENRQVLRNLTERVDISHTTDLSLGAIAPTKINGTIDDSAEICAHSHFRIFATMNPGGDFGKRELSPALRSRFTEIWVPPVTACRYRFGTSSIEILLPHESSVSSIIPEFKTNMLNYVD